jgi:hypothetical protein
MEIRRPISLEEAAAQLTSTSILLQKLNNQKCRFICNASNNFEFLDVQGHSVLSTHGLGHKMTSLPALNEKGLVRFPHKCPRQCRILEASCDPDEIRCLNLLK